MSRSRKVGFATATAVTVLIVIELAARAALALGLGSATKAVGSNWLTVLRADLGGNGESLPEIYAPDADLFWRLEPGIDAMLPNAVYETRGAPSVWHLSINADGHRGPAYPECCAAPVIVVLGDSCSFGFRVDDEQTYPRQLEAKLHQMGAREARVVNLSVPGYSSFQGRRQLARVLRQHRPDVVLLAFGANDLEPDRRSDSAKAADVGRQRLELGYAARRLGVVRLLDSLTAADRAAPDARRSTVRRVSPAEYRENLSAMVELAHSADVGVVLLDLVFLGPHFRYTIQKTAERHQIPWLDGRAVLRRNLVELEPGGRLAAERTSLDQFWDEQVVRYRQVYYDDEFYLKLFADPERAALLRYLMVEPVHQNALGNRLLAEEIAQVLVDASLVRF